jgi:GTPase SAR1 family protein
MKFAQLVVGPAGSGKSTYCETIKNHCDAINRSVHVVNLDPAAEEFKYPVSADVRDLITLDDVMQELQLGPNGGLLYCMEYLEDNLEEWLGGELQAYGDDDYLLFDCPGQIELYSHLSVFKTFVDYLKRDGWQICVVYCLDSQFTSEMPKFIAGTLQALSAMVQLELPHVNVLTKADLCKDKQGLEAFRFPDPSEMRHELDKQTGPHFRRLNDAVVQLLDDFAMVTFTPLDINDEESVEELLLQIDMAIQYGEDQEVKTQELGDMYDPEGDE